MRNRNADVMDFYRQLSLLLKSNLPLPESLRQLASSFRNRRFRGMLEKLAADISEGRPLSTSMKQFPEYFQPFQIKMVESGEKSGTLFEILAELAYNSHIDHQLVLMVKAFAAYPLFVIAFSLSVMFFLFSFVVPGFRQIFSELLGNSILPSITNLVLDISGFYVHYFNAILGLLVVGWIFLLWIFISASSLSSLCFIRLIRLLPLSNMIFGNLAMARICSMWSVMAKHRTPVHEALEVISGLLEIPRISKALKNVSRKNLEGRALAESLAEEDSISGMISLAVRNSQEKDLPDELATLADIYKDRAMSSIRNVGLTWEILLICIMSSIVGTVVISLFMPLIAIIDKLGAC